MVIYLIKLVDLHSKGNAKIKMIMWCMEKLHNIELCIELLKKIKIKIVILTNRKLNNFLKKIV